MTDFLDHVAAELEHGDACLCDGCYRRRFDESFAESTAIRELANADDIRASRDRALDVLQTLLRALPERLAYEFSHDSERLLVALWEAQALLVEAGRAVK